MTMGNQFSSCSQRSTPPTLKIENMDLLREEAQKLFTADLGLFHRGNGDLKSGDKYSNRDRTLRQRTSTSSSKHHNLLYILRKVRDMTEDVGSSNSTRGTIESPVFPLMMKRSQFGVQSESPTSLKARTGSLLSHLKIGFLGSQRTPQINKELGRGHFINGTTDDSPRSLGCEYNCSGDLTPLDHYNHLPPHQPTEGMVMTTTMKEEESLPKRSSNIPVNQHSSDDEDPDVEHLKRLYDSRTWDMYLRITEARQKANYRSTQIPPVVVSKHSAPVFPELPDDLGDDDYEDGSMQISEHDLVFGDLDGI